MFDIIIATYNAKSSLRRCLKSLERHTGRMPHRLTICNDNSTDDTACFLAAYKKKHKDVNILHTVKNLGFSGACNLGLRNTSNKFIVLLDDDTEVTEGWLEGLYEQIRRRPAVGIVGCKIVFPDKRVMSADYRVADLQLAGFGEIDRGQRDYIKECDALVGTCWLMRRAVVRQTGYFDTRFFPSQHEDIDYCLRARLAGYKLIYTGKVAIKHVHLFRDGGEDQNSKNQQKFLKKWKKQLERFPLSDSHPAEKCIARGIKHFSSKDHAKALGEFYKAESMGKHYFEPGYTGMILLQLKDYASAAKKFEQVLWANPGNNAARLHKGIALKEAGRYAAAISEFKKVRAKGNLDFLKHYYLAVTLHKMGRIHEAKKESVIPLSRYPSYKNNSCVSNEYFLRYRKPNALPNSQKRKGRKLVSPGYAKGGGGEKPDAFFL